MSENTTLDAPDDSTVEQEIMDARRAKLAALAAAGTEPYPFRADVTCNLGEMRAQYESIDDGTETNDEYQLAGRLMAKRGHGKVLFCDLRDRSGKVQLHVTLDRLGDADFELFSDLDLGDWIAVTGTAMKTRRGEVSLAVSGFALLAKCIRPLPEKFHGLTDIETRLSRRYLDLVMNESTMATFVLRSKVVSAIRRFLEDRGYLEVETPVLQPIYGGAAARPFVTHHNELDQQLFLRVATELYLKRLIVGGLDKVYEIGKNFRNEGVSFKHNPEFTMIELYEAYADYNDIMELFEQMVHYVAVETCGSSTVTSGDGDDAVEIDFTTPWNRETLRDSILKRAEIDIYASSEDDLRERLERDDVDTSHDKTWAQLVDHLLSKYVEPFLIQPTFLTDYPIELSPFAKKSRENPEIVERFECFVGGMELSNAFSELNDPADQYERFMSQGKARDAGDDTAEQLDEDYIRALEYGLPPTGGLGMGIDRLTMLLAGQRSIREVILFPARKA